MKWLSPLNAPSDWDYYDALEELPEDYDEIFIDRDADTEEIK